MDPRSQARSQRIQVHVGKMLPLAALFALFATFLQSNQAFAFGPLTSGGHMIIEEFAGSLRVTLQIHRNHVPAILKEDPEHFSRDDLAKLAFKETIGASHLRVEGEACRWQKPGGILSESAITLQVLAQCGRNVQGFEWELSFVKALPDYFTLFVEAELKQGRKKFVITPAQSRIEYRPFDMRAELEAGLFYVGLAREAWISGTGELQLPKGFALILCLMALFTLTRTFPDFLIFSALFMLIHFFVPLTGLWPAFHQLAVAASTWTPLLILCAALIGVLGPKPLAGRILGTLLLGYASGAMAYSVFADFNPSTPLLNVPGVFFFNLGVAAAYGLGLFLLGPWIYLALRDLRVARFSRAAALVGLSSLSLSFLLASLH